MACLRGLGFSHWLCWWVKSSSIYFDLVCSAHRNQLYKQSNKMHFLYVFILQFLSNSTCFQRPFRSSSGVHDLLYLQLCTNRVDLIDRKTEQLDTFVRFVQSCRYSKSWTPDDERNGRSKHVELYKNCRIKTNRKCILLVCSYNLLEYSIRRFEKL